MGWDGMGWDVEMLGWAGVGDGLGLIGVCWRALDFWGGARRGDGVVGNEVGTRSRGSTHHYY